MVHALPSLIEVNVAVVDSEEGRHGPEGSAVKVSVTFPLARSVEEGWYIAFNVAAFG